MFSRVTIDFQDKDKIIHKSLGEIEGVSFGTIVLKWTRLICIYFLLGLGTCISTQSIHVLYIPFITQGLFLFFPTVARTRCKSRIVFVSSKIGRPMTLEVFKLES
jgi:hypothetical protein